MVVTNRSVSSSYVDTLRNEKYALPYGDGQLDRASFTASMPLPSQTVLESQASDKKVQTRKLIACMPALMKISFLIATSYSIYSLRTELSVRESELATIRHDFDDVEDALLLNEAEVDNAHTSLFNLQSQFMSLLPGTPENAVTRGQEFNGGELYQKVVDRQNAMKTRVTDLQHTIADLHRGEAIEHFGSQQYRLKFNLLIDNKVFSFVVEMAPLDLMPHSVHFFMKMVKAQVWDNSIFTHRSKHILLAELKDSAGNDKHDIFVEKNISTLAFPEYSSDYPHEKYTLGFGGRPGGPGWYINTVDNAMIHGPGGQTDYHLGEDADSCFAKVIEGHGVIDWMQARNEKESTDELFTIIESIRIL